MLSVIKRRLRSEAFCPTALAVVISPVYFIRAGLYRAISSLAPEIRGCVLDFGCGSKPYEALFESATKYIGVDIEVSGHNHRNSRVDIYYDGKNLPFANEQFDAIVSFEVFEHVFDIDETLAELRRVLTPGGKLLISVPFAWDEHEAPYDFARYTSFGISHVLRMAGFEVVELRKTTTYMAAIAQMFIAFMFQHVLPRSGIFRVLSQLLIIFPLNLMGLLADAISPRRFEYFCGSVVLARKVS